jgi:hypothetical protein
MLPRKDADEKVVSSTPSSKRHSRSTIRNTRSEVEEPSPAIARAKRRKSSREEMAALDKARLRKPFRKALVEATTSFKLPKSKANFNYN